MDSSSKVRTAVTSLGTTQFRTAVVLVYQDSWSECVSEVIAGMSGVLAWAIYSTMTCSGAGSLTTA